MGLRKDSAERDVFAKYSSEALTGYRDRTDTIGVDLRDACAAAFRKAVPRLGALAAGEVDASTVHEQLMASRILGRYAFGAAKSVLIEMPAYDRAIYDAVGEVFSPDDELMNQFHHRVCVNFCDCAMPKG